MAPRASAPVAPRRPAGRPRRRTGAASRLLEVRLADADPDEALGALLARHRARGRLLGCRRTGDGIAARRLRWLEVEASPAELAGLLAGLRAPERRVAHADLGRGRALVRIVDPLPPVCAAILGAEGLCLECPGTRPRAVAGPTVILDRPAGAARLRRDLRGRAGPRARVERAGPPRGAASPTAGQEEALRAAFELGYFRYPRGATLADVARHLGVGRSTALERMRRALDGLVRRRFDEGDR